MLVCAHRVYTYPMQFQKGIVWWQQIDDELPTFEVCVESAPGFTAAQQSRNFGDVPVKSKRIVSPPRLDPWVPATPVSNSSPRSHEGKRSCTGALEGGTSKKKCTPSVSLPMSKGVLSRYEKAQEHLASHRAGKVALDSSQLAVHRVLICCIEDVRSRNVSMDCVPGGATSGGAKSVIGWIQQWNASCAGNMEHAVDVQTVLTAVANMIPAK
jgi:hypothetical protein